MRGEFLRMWTEGIFRGRANGELKENRTNTKWAVSEKNVRRVTFMVRCYFTGICKDAWFFNVRTSCVIKCRWL